MSRNLAQFIVQSNQVAARGVVPLADVAPWEAVAVRRPRRPVGGGEASGEGEGGGEEVADAGEVVTAGGSDGEAGVAARA